MNPKTSITRNPSGTQSWRSCLQLLVALAILCWGSLARAQQSETWMGTNTVNYNWSTPSNWVDNATGVNERPTSLGDNLTFGGKGAVLVPAAAKAPQNNYPFLGAITTNLNVGLQFFSYTNTFATNTLTYTNLTLPPTNTTYFTTNVVVTTNAPLSAWTTNLLKLTNVLTGSFSGSTNVLYITNTIASFTNALSFVTNGFAATNNLVVNSITFTTNGFILGGNSLTISNGITDNYGGNTNAIPMIIGAAQTFQNNSSIIGTNANYFTNTESGTINLFTNTLTLAGSAPLFLTGVISSTNGGQLVINNGGTGVPGDVGQNGGPTFNGAFTRLAVANVFGTNVVQITNYFSGAGTFNPAITNYYTNSYSIITNGVTNITYFVSTNVIAAVTNGSYVYATNTFGPQNADAVWVQAGTLQLNNGSALPSGANVGNISVDGYLDMNGQNITINGLEDSGAFTGYVDNSTNNNSTYTLTVGNANSNAVFTGIIQDTYGTVALNKTGYGTETLNGGNQYVGQTTISQGTLAVGAEGSLGQHSSNLKILAGAVLDVTAVPGGYYPYAGLTVAAGTPTKPYTNLVSFDPHWGTNPTNYVVTIGTNTIVTYMTNTDLATYTNVIATTNISGFSYSTNSIISIVNADVKGSFNVVGGGAISPVTTLGNGIATWAINGNLLMDNSAGYGPNRINFALGNTTTPGGGTNDLVTVSGTLKIGDELDFVINPLTGVLTNGTYTLVTSSGYIPETGSHAPILKVVLERGLQGDSVTAQGNNIVLNSLGGTAYPGSIIWGGTPTVNNWDVDLTQNWVTNGPTYPNADYFFPGDNVNFNDIGYGTVNLNAIVSPGSMAFNNSKTNYTFAQSTSYYIAGNGGLVKNGTGTVLLQEPNKFTGDVTVNGGILNLGYYGSGDRERVLYNGVPAGNLILGGGTINENETVASTSPEGDFNNLTIMPGASTISQSARTASSVPVYSFSNNVTRVVGGVLNLAPTGPTTGGSGIYFYGTNSPDGTNDYGVNGILGGYATLSLNDWAVANSRQGNNGANAYGAYQTDNNPADWGAASNVVVSANPPSSLNTMWINSLKWNNTVPVTVTINSGQKLTISSGGVLLPSGVSFPATITGGTLLGATNADLILLEGSPGAVLTIGSVIADNTNALATQGSGLTTGESGTIVLSGNNTYTGPTIINPGFGGTAGATLQIGANGTSGSIASSSAIIDNGTLAFSRSDNTSVGAVSGTGNLKKFNTGALTLTANNSLSGLVTISGGTLQLGNGGASGSVSNTVGIVDNGTLAFDNNNTVGYPNPISGVGGLVQFGSGNLIIATNETYTGNTVVSNGTMTVTASGSIPNSASIAINAGATLDVSALNGGAGLTLRSATPAEVLTGSGAINGSLTTAPGTTTQPTPSSGAYGTLTINNGNLTMSGGNFRFDVGNGNGNHDLINVSSGTLTENSGTVIINVTGAALNNGVYPLIHASGGVPGGTVTNLVVAGFNQSGQIAQLINDPSFNNLDLLVSGGTISTLTWVGDGSANIWDLNTTPNWNAGAGATTYANPSYTTFDDTGSASPAVNITAQVSPTAITNSANVNNYVLGANTGSAGKITGGASLVKTGTSQLTLQTLNDYLDGTTINAGTVQLGNNTNAAEDGMVGSGAVVIGVNGSLVVSNFATETINGPISGGGSLWQAGVGKLVLAGNNSAFAGPITIGPVITGTNGSSTNILQVGNGVSGTLGTGSVTNNGSLVFNNPGSVPVNASIGGLGSVTNLGIGTVTLNGTDTYAGNTIIAAGTVRVGSANAIPPTSTVVLNVGAGVSGILDLNGNNVVVAGLSGANGAAGGNFTPSYVVNNGGGTATLTVNNGTNTFWGVLADNNLGAGKLALDVVQNGTNWPVLMLNPITNNLGTATANVNTFSGGLLVSNATVNLGATFSGNTIANVGSAAAGLGPIILAGTNTLNSLTNGLSNTNGYGGKLLPDGYNLTTGDGYIYTTIGTVIVPAGQCGTISQPGEGSLVINSLQGSGTLYMQPGSYVRAYYDGVWTNFTGTVVFQDLTGGNGNFSFNSAGTSLPYANVVMMTNMNNGSTVFAGRVAGMVLQWGSLSGGDSTSLICGSSDSGGNGGQPTIYAIGSLNTSTTNGSQWLDAGVGIMKVGTGTLTLTNNNMKYTGETVVSNGTLAFALTPGALTNYDYPNTANYFEGTNFTIVAPGILDVTGASTNQELYLGHNGFTQSLFGSGTLNGNLITASNNTYIAPGYRANNGAKYAGSQLKVNGYANISFSTIAMCINSTAGVGGTATNDSLATTGALTINSALLTVINTGGQFPASSTNVFQFFQGAVPVNIGVGGGAGITNIILPAAVAGEYWITNLAVNGSMVLVDTNVVTFNSAAPPMQVSVQTTVGGETLTLGWPTNLGWILQSQTNKSSVGFTPATNWVDVAGSATQTNAVFTINPTNPAVFYRLRNPSAPVQ